MQELHAALQSMQGGTAPGTDGLPAEFYKTFCLESGGRLPVLELQEVLSSHCCQNTRPAGHSELEACESAVH